MEEIKGNQGNAEITRGCGGAKCGCKCRQEESNYNSNSNADGGRNAPPHKCRCTCDPVGEAQSAHESVYS